LPSVDPNNYPGTVHFGPSTGYVGQGIGQYSAGGGYGDPYLGAGGAAGIYPGY